MPLIVTPGELERRAELYHQLGASISAGIPLLKALEMLANNPIGYGDRRSLMQIIHCVQSGASFTESLSSARGLLPDFDRALLAAGETSGRLDSTFRLLSEYYRSRAQIIRRAIADVLMTVVTLHVFLLIFPLTYLVGFVQGLMNGNYAACLPFILQKLAVFGILYGGVFFLVFACQGGRGEHWRAMMERISMAVPILGTAVRYLNIARLSAALEALIRSGVSIITSWQMGAAASGSVYLKSKIASWKVQLENGSTPAELVNSTPYFPEMFSHLYFSGEQSGKLDDALDRLHNYYQEEGFRLLRLFTRVLNGLIYGAVVVMVAFNVIRFYMQYYGAMFAQ